MSPATRVLTAPTSATAADQSFAGRHVAPVPISFDGVLDRLEEEELQGSRRRYPDHVRAIALE